MRRNCPARAWGRAREQGRGGAGRGRGRGGGGRRLDGAADADGGGRHRAVVALPQLADATGAVGAGHDAVLARRGARGDGERRARRHAALRADGLRPRPGDLHVVTTAALVAREEQHRLRARGARGALVRDPQPQSGPVRHGGGGGRGSDGGDAEIGPPGGLRTGCRDEEHEREGSAGEQRDRIGLHGPREPAVAPLRRTGERSARKLAKNRRFGRPTWRATDDSAVDVRRGRRQRRKPRARGRPSDVRPPWR